MKQIIGNAARKEQFYPRNDVRARILDSVRAGENILISAPRRVGKTSVLINFIDNSDPDFFGVYLDLESVDSSEEFFRLILKQILSTDGIENFGHFGKSTKSMLTKWANKIASLSIASVGISLNQPLESSAYDQFCDFLNEINLEGKKILIMIDEFPTTIDNIKDKHGDAAALLFLNMNRSLRMNTTFGEKVKFIYCGSISLLSVVSKLRGTDRINDLREIKIGALRKTEAKDFVHQLLEEKSDQKLGDELLDYILEKVEWWIPFYFQLFVHEFYELIAYENGTWSKETVDIAMENVSKNGNIYFEHQRARLERTRDLNEKKFKLQLLADIAKRGSIGYDEIINLAEKNKVRTQIQNLLDELMYDGYLVDFMENDLTYYKFYSPFLKRWWR